MKIKFNVYKNREILMNGYPSHIRDLFEFMKNNNIYGRYIIDIDAYDYNNNSYEINNVTNILSGITKNAIFIIRSYVSTSEYSEDEYYLSDNEKDENKKKLPINEVLTREDEIIKRAGYLDISEISNLEFNKVYLYPSYRYPDNETRKAISYSIINKLEQQKTQ